MNELTEIEVGDRVKLVKDLMTRGDMPHSIIAPTGSSATVVKITSAVWLRIDRVEFDRCIEADELDLIAKG